MNKKQQTLLDVGDIDLLLQRLEELLDYINHSQAISNTMFDTIRRDCEYLIQDIRLKSSEQDIHPESMQKVTESSWTLPGNIGMDSRKLQQTYKLLTQYPAGTTADEIARSMKRHRTTVSTYLNQLVKEHLAVKHREGHEIYYRAILNIEGGTSE